MGGRGGQIQKRREGQARRFKNDIVRFSVLLFICAVAAVPQHLRVVVGNRREPYPGPRTFRTPSTTPCVLR